MRVEFTKMHGLGNDFIVFDAPAANFEPSTERLQSLADRHTGIGFDQALMLEPRRRSDTAAYYRIFNSDGSEVEQCGNGVRCVAALLMERGRAAPGNLSLDSPAGVIRVRIESDGLYSVDMGVPNFEPGSLPFKAATVLPIYQLAVAGQRLEFGAVSMGNPHAVLSVPSVESAHVVAIGTALQSHASFPKRVNVGFMQIINHAHIALRVFERGVGETLACGTGACAAVAVGRQQGRLADRVEVRLPGGTLVVQWPGPGASLWLTGPAVTVFTGQVEILGVPDKS